MKWKVQTPAVRDLVKLCNHWKVTLYAVWSCAWSISALSGIVKIHLTHVSTVRTGQGNLSTVRTGQDQSQHCSNRARSISALSKQGKVNLSIVRTGQGQSQRCLTSSKSNSALSEQRWDWSWTTFFTVLRLILTLSRQHWDLSIRCSALSRAPYSYI